MSPPAGITRSSSAAGSPGGGLLVTVAAQNEAARVFRREQATRRRNAAIDAGKALVRTDAVEAEGMSAREAEASRTQRIRRRMMEARERREERSLQNPPSFGPGSTPMFAAMYSHASSPPRLLKDARGLRATLRPSTSVGGLPLPPPGLQPSAVEPGLLTSSVSLASMAHYPSGWRPHRLRKLPVTHANNLIPGAGLASPYKRPPTAPDDEAHKLILSQIAEARSTPVEPGRHRPRLPSLPKLPQNNLKGFDIPVYEQQAFFGCDKRAVPYW